MNEYRITANGNEKKIVKLPSGRHDVTIEQWNNAYKYIELAMEANRLFEEGQVEKSQAKVIESMCGTIAALGAGITFEELMQVEYNKINNLFLIQFGWLSEEKPKRNFKIKGKKFSVPNYEQGTCGDFMDVMSLLAMHEEYNDAEKGLLIAAVYMRNGEYYQDLEEINQRIEFLKKYGKNGLILFVRFFFVQFVEELQNRHPATFGSSKGTGKANKYLSQLGYYPLFANVAECRSIFVRCSVVEVLEERFKQIRPSAKHKIR
jgi:hypothetical protein